MVTLIPNGTPRILILISWNNLQPNFFPQDVPSNEILGFFDDNFSVDNRLIELLSMNTLKDGTVECFVASRENDLFLPKEDTIDHLDGMKIDLPGM